MAAGKEEKKDEKGKDGKEEKKKVDIEVITAIYKLNLHCKECGNKIKNHLMTTQGIYQLILINHFPYGFMCFFKIYYFICLYI